MQDLLVGRMKSRERTVRGAWWEEAVGMVTGVSQEVAPGSFNSLQDRVSFDRWLKLLVGLSVNA